MGKTLPLFANEIDIKDYRFSAWITNAKEPAYDVWTMCKPRANDENTIKELKEDFALGGFSLKRFYAVEAAMVLRVLVYNLFLLFRHEFLGKKGKEAAPQNLALQVLCASCPDGKHRERCRAQDIGAKQEGTFKALLPVYPHQSVSSKS